MTKKIDRTRNDRALRRLTQKNNAAKAAGWASWSAFETAVINNQVSIPSAWEVKA